MSALLNIDELLSQVTELTKNLPIPDGRVATRFTERTIRYYVTQGYVRPPLRHKGKSMWSEDHIKDLVRIRRAQSAGQSLGDIELPAIIDTTPSWKAANLGVNRLQLAHKFESVITEPGGWAFQISHNVQLSGFTDRRPTQQEIQRVTTALSALISFTDDSSTEQEKDPS